MIHDLIDDHPQHITANWVYLRFHGVNYGGSYTHQALTAQATGGINEHGMRKPGLRINGKHRPGCPGIGADHFLYTHRQRHLQVVKTFCLPVADGAVGGQRGVAVAAGLLEGVGAGDVVVSCAIVNS
jgi:hypothetical protein